MADDEEDVSEEEKALRADHIWDSASTLDHKVFRFHYDLDKGSLSGTGFNPPVERQFRQVREAFESLEPEITKFPDFPKLKRHYEKLKSLFEEYQIDPPRKLLGRRTGKGWELGQDIFYQLRPLLHGLMTYREEIVKGRMSGKLDDISTVSLVTCSYCRSRVRQGTKCPECGAYL